jgi:small nuclear ribonucleoprotein (snRNP)-like protein
MSSQCPKKAPMKMLLQVFLATALLGLASGVLASPTIELKDGSRIQGEIQGIENGMYIVISPSIGTVHIAQSNIARIVYGGDAANAANSSVRSPATNDAMASEVQQMQKSLAQDPAAMQSIMSLQSDPQIQAILNDPAIMKAVQEGDYMSLLGNAKIQGLESNAHLKQLLQQQAH